MASRTSAASRSLGRSFPPSSLGLESSSFIGRFPWESIREILHRTARPGKIDLEVQANKLLVRERVVVGEERDCQCPVHELILPPNAAAHGEAGSHWIYLDRSGTLAFNCPPS